MEYVKFDMHLHTKEGSSDSKVTIRETIDILMQKGFKGCLVTDHDSYKGFDSLKEEEIIEYGKKGFSVLKAIEYDTADFGHMIVVLPKDRIPSVLDYRGLKLNMLQDIVHDNGGIIGAAHPCGEPFLSFFTTGFSVHKSVIKRRCLAKIDFIEGFNAYEPKDSNLFARKLAFAFKKPMTGGSDSHKAESVGLGYAYLPASIKTEEDLITFIKSKPDIRIGGKTYGKSTKDKLGRLNHFLVYGFYYYNKFETLINYYNRKKYL